MPGARSNSSSSSPGKIFTGVQFVLVGFDSVSESQYRSELVNRGATDVGRYDSICTHVIVCGRVYDDPLCVAARHDGKALVTELWIEDSLSFGMLADAARVLYWPVKDLNGIPGSESLRICLTGYQRQERDDIMKLVSLMGARFSKPLIANQVTHLICYKFEGEKYELAKKVNIKLVNHRWLEDCLTAWKILSEDNYAKSSWELEILAAEARDSEEETEDPGANTKSMQIPTGASSLQVGMAISVGTDLSIPLLENSNIQQKTVSSKPIPRSDDRFKNQRFYSTPSKEATSTKDINPCDLNNKILQEFDRQDDRSHGNLSSRHNDNVEREGNMSSSHIRVPKRGFPESNAVDERASGLDDSRKTLRKAISVDKPSNIMQNSPQQNTAGNMFNVVDEKLSNLSCSRKTLSKSISADEPSNILHTFQQNKAGNMLENAEKSTNLDYSRKVPNESISVDEPSNKLLISPQQSIAENIYQADLPETTLKQESVRTQSPTASLQKRKNSVPSAESRQSEVPCAPPCPSSTRKSATSTHCILNNGLTETSNCTEGAAVSISKVRAEVAPSKLKSLSYKKKSLKSRKPALGTEIANSSNSPSVKKKAELQFDGCQKPASVETMSTENKSTSLGTDLDASRTSNIVLRDLPLDDEPKSPTDETSVLDVRCTDQTSAHEIPKESPDGSTKLKHGTKSDNGSDIAMHDTPTKESVQNSRLQQDGALSPDGTKTVSSATTSNTHKKNGAKAPFSARNRKVVSKKSFGSKNLSGGNSRKTKSEQKICIERNESVNKVGVGEELEHSTAKGDSKKISIDPEKKNKPKKNQSRTVSTNSHQDSKLLRKQSKNLSCGDSRKTKSGKIKPEQEICLERNEAVKPVNKVGVREELQHSTAEKGDGKKISIDPEKENKPKENQSTHQDSKLLHKQSKKSAQICKRISADNSSEMQTVNCGRSVRSEPKLFLLSGHRFQRKEFQMVIKRLRGRLCRDSHTWSYQATHLVVPEPLRRTEKLFAATAAGRWILKSDYLSACSGAGKFLEEEPFEWHGNGLSEDGAISLEAPRKWRLLRERTGHGALYGMRIIIYGDCIAPTLDTLKRVVKAGDGAILATSPPYTRFLNSNIDYAVVSTSMPRVDAWVQEFLKHKIPCVVADYLVEYVCKPGYSLERHVLFKTVGWAEKSFASLLSRSEEVVVAADDGNTVNPLEDDMICSVCGSSERGEVMLICGDEGGTVGCGVGTHINCCDPPLNSVPEGDWFCSKCSTSKGNKRKRLSSRCLK